MIAVRFPDGRLHLQHGPIDLIIEAFGASDEVERAYRQAIDCFGDILPILVRELPALRRPVGDAYPLLQGPVARRMAEAVWPHRDVYITPMAAVAGAVADEMLQALVRGRTLDFRRSAERLDDEVDRPMLQMQAAVGQAGGNGAHGSSRTLWARSTSSRVTAREA